MESRLEFVQRIFISKIEDARATCESKGLKKEQTALFLLEHLAGEARQEIL